MTMQWPAQYSSLMKSMKKVLLEMVETKNRVFLVSPFDITTVPTQSTVMPFTATLELI